MREPIDLLVTGETVITMDPQRRVLPDAAVAVRGDRIVAVGDTAELTARFDAREHVGGAGRLVLPGLVNAHQHLTGDRLVRSAIPDDLPPGVAITDWALPVHAGHTADDDELSATLSLVEAVGNGITFTVEAGTVAHPERVLAAFDAVGVGGTLGSWGWDVGDGPWAGTVDEVLRRQRAVLELTAGHPRVHGWVTLVGHDLMSDELVVAASRLAREHATGLTFHLSPSAADPVASLARTGVRPVTHLARLGALGPHVLVAHGVHLDDDEVGAVIDHDVAIASCPWAYLRLGQGFSGHARHLELRDAGVRVALGCDSENAGDAIDVLLAARLFAGLAKDVATDPTRGTAADVLAMATIGGARAVGLAHDIGSLEPGKRADVVVLDTTRAEWTPMSPDPVRHLVWAADGRCVHDVVASGRVVVRDGRCTTVDHRALASRSHEVRDRLLGRVRADPRDQ